MPRPANTFISGSGTGAPPQMSMRIEVRSASLNGGTWLMNRNIAGTPKIVVTPYFGTSASAATGSKLRWRTISPPFCSVSSVVTLSPPMWNSGANTSVTSSSRMSSVLAALALFHQKLACVSIAPFGRPVVPEVYMMTATASASTAGVSRDRCGRVERALRSRPIRRMPIVLDAEPSLHRHVVADRVEHGAVVAVGDHRVAAGIVDDELEFGAGEPEVQRHEDRPEAGRGEHRLEERRVVETEVADPVARSDPAVAEHGRGAVDPLLQLSVGESSFPRT